MKMLDETDWILRGKIAFFNVSDDLVRENKQKMNNSLERRRR